MSNFTGLLSFNGAALRRERRQHTWEDVQKRRKPLQWGRSPKRAETAREQHGPLGEHLASMGPLSEESGDAQTTDPQDIPAAASMGPLSEESGDYRYRYR